MRGAPAGQLAERQQHRGQHREAEEPAAATGPAVRSPAPKSRPLAERDIADRRKRRFRTQEWPVPCAGASPIRSPASHEQRLAASPPAATWGPQGPIAHAIHTPRVPYTECARTIGASRWPWPLRALLLLPAMFLLLLRPPPPPPVPLLLNLENTKPSALRQRSCPGQTPPFRAVQRPHENAMEREDAVKTWATSEHNTEAATRSKQVSEVRLRAGLEQAAPWTKRHGPVTALDQEEGQQHLRAVARLRNGRAISIYRAAIARAGHEGGQGDF